MSNALKVVEATEQAMIDSVEREERAFTLAQRKAKMYASSGLVPKDYQNNIANVMIAMNMAQRSNADPVMVMQNLHMIHGRPGWSATYLIACFNLCGRFTAIRYRFTGKPGTPSHGCIAYTTELQSGEVVEGTEITVAMAKAEGWLDKAGSKWKTMPEQMLRYRAATFLIRATAPELGMGFYTQDEIHDFAGEPAQPRRSKSMVVDAVTTKAIEYNVEPHDYTADLESSVTFSDLTALRATIDSDDTIPAEERGQLLLEIDDRLAVMGEEAGGGR